MNNIQLHELMVSLREDVYVRITMMKNDKLIEILEGKVVDIDIIGIHHNKVVSIRYGYVAITIEIEGDDYE
jgi:hypothetical protein